MLTSLMPTFVNKKKSFMPTTIRFNPQRVDSPHFNLTRAQW